MRGPRSHPQNAFTLLELLTVVAVIVILLALFLPAIQSAKVHANESGDANNLQQLGAAFDLYAGDNSMRIPSTYPGPIYPYLKDPRVLAAPGDPNNYIILGLNPLSTTGGNNTSYIYNGFNDLGIYTNRGANVLVPMADIPYPSDTVLLGRRSKGVPDFYMDFNTDDENGKVNLTAYDGGANYLFANGTVRFLTASEYQDTLWLVNKNWKIPDVQ